MQRQLATEIVKSELTSLVIVFSSANDWSRMLMESQLKL